MFTYVPHKRRPPRGLFGFRPPFRDKILLFGLMSLEVLPKKFFPGVCMLGQSCWICQAWLPGLAAWCQKDLPWEKPGFTDFQSFVWDCIPLPPTNTHPHTPRTPTPTHIHQKRIPSAIKQHYRIAMWTETKLINLYVFYVYRVFAGSEVDPFPTTTNVGPPSIMFRRSPYFSNTLPKLADFSKPLGVFFYCSFEISTQAPRGSSSRFHNRIWNASCDKSRRSSF